MRESKRIIINTIAQYTKAVINTCLSLYTVRLVLKILGQSDYGIMSIVGGIIVLLGFITNALVITTQRHLSYDYGSKTTEETRKTFSNCVFLHLIIGISIVAILLILEPIIVNPSFLNIQEGRWEATHVVYKVVSFVLFFSFLTSPFKALLIARENIVFISVIETLDGFLKLFIVLLLPSLSIDKLIAYSLMLLGIMVFEFLVFTSYDIIRYSECDLRHIKQDISRRQLKELSGFAGWTTYGTGAIIARNQGIAWLINHFYNTVINASYGIANQMFSAVQFISSSITNAMNPQIMKAEGSGNRDNMWAMAELESRSIVCMMIILFIPIMAEINGLLRLWLEDVPPYTSVFCIALLSAFLIDQTTSGLNSANQAIGNIKVYTLIMYTPKILMLPIAYLLIYCGHGVESVMALFVSVEALVAFARLPYMHIQAKLDISHYLKTVLGHNILLLAFMILATIIVCHTSNYTYRFLYSIPTLYILGVLFAWFVVLSDKERKGIKALFIKK